MILTPERFKQARGKRSIAEVAFAMAKQLGSPVSYYTLRNWELGKTNPNERLFEVYCKVVGKPKRYFIGGERSGETEKAA